VRRLRQTGAIGGVLAICTFSAALCEDAPANRGLVEALDGIVREACDYWTEGQYSAMHAMLVQSLGAPGLRKLADEERQVLLDSFRVRVEALWDLRESSLKFQMMVADLGWRLQSFLERKPLDEQLRSRICEQAKHILTDTAGLTRPWSGKPFEWFIDEMLREAQDLVDKDASDPLSLGLRRLLTKAEVKDLNTRMATRWQEEQRLLEDRLRWLSGLKFSNTKSMLATASETVLCRFLAEARTCIEGCTVPQPAAALRELSAKAAAELRARANRPAQRTDEADPVRPFMGTLTEPYRSAIRETELSLTTLDLAFLLRWCEGGEVAFIP